MLDKLIASALGRAAESVASISFHKKVEPDAILARLALTAKLYSEPTPFRPGDLVTPRADGKANGVGEPHVVVEVFDGEAPLPGLDEATSWSAPIVLRDPTAAADTTASTQYGQVLDMRVARFTGSTVAAYVVESQDFEAWTPEHEEAWRSKLAAAAAGPQPLSLADAIVELRDGEVGRKVEIEWKEGDTVGIVPEPQGAQSPMQIKGHCVGVVKRVEVAEGMTQVAYHSASTGRVTPQWIRSVDLRKWGPKPAQVSAPAALADATA